MPPIKALSLDAAGTLFDLAEPVGETYARIGRQHGFHFHAETLQKQFLHSFRNLPSPDYSKYPDGHSAETAWWRDVVRLTTGSPSSPAFENYFKSLFNHYTRPEAWTLFPETREFLSVAGNNYRLLVVSNFDSRLHSILESLDIAQFFEAIISSADARARKPALPIFELARQTTAIPPESILHIGDSKTADFEGALAAGWQAYLLKRPDNQLFDALQ